MTAPGWLRAWTCVITLSCAFFLKHEWGDWGGTRKLCCVGAKAVWFFVCELMVERVYPQWGRWLFLLMLPRWAPPALVVSLVAARGEYGRKTSDNNLTKSTAQAQLFGVFFLFIHLQIYFSVITISGWMEFCIVYFFRLAFYDKHVLTLLLFISPILSLWYYGASGPMCYGVVNHSSLLNMSSTCYNKALQWISFCV